LVTVQITVFCDVLLFVLTSTKFIQRAARLVLLLFDCKAKKDVFQLEDYVYRYMPAIIARPWSLDARNVPFTIWLSPELRF
jgi:hypothetical protein